MTTTTFEHLFTYFGLQKNPFGASPDSRFFFSTPAHESALAELLFAIQTRQGLMLLTGECGAGKTTLLQQLLDTLDRRRISSSYVFHSRLDVDSLFRFILQDFGAACASDRKGEILEKLHEWLVERHAAGDTPVIVIDEAQALPIDTIDELRLLLNLEGAPGKLVQIILSGQPELNEMLRKPELRQLRQRVMFRSKLPLLTSEETSAYIRARLSIAGLPDPRLFPPETVDAIFQYSRGIPRTINLLGEHALINAYAERAHSITPEAIHYIAADFDLVQNPLSVKQDAAEERQHPVHFPAPSQAPQSGSLSALRLAFLAEEPLQKAGPSASVPPRASSFAIERLLELADTPPSRAARPPVEFDPVPGPPTTALTTPPPAPRPIEVPAVAKQEMIAPAEEEPPEPRATSTILAETFPPAPAKNSVFLRYWKDIAGSFRRDLRVFERDCASVFRPTRVEKPGPARKHSGLPV